jgi:hypothetical protein
MTAKAQVKTQAKTPAAPTVARIPQSPVAGPEHEAERPDIAAQLDGAARLGHSLGAVSVDRPAPPIIQRQEIPEEEEEELQLKWEPSAVQRQEIPEEEEEELMMKRDDQRVGPQGGQVPPEVAAAIHRARGGGQPLEAVLQAQMSARLGHDFSGVRVHADSEADALNQRLSAKAFTTGPDIFFKRGTYEPGSSSGRELIAHELSHVTQQDSGRVPGGGGGMTVRPAGDGFEQEAEAQAQRVSGHRAVPRLLPQRETEETTVQRALSKFDVNAAKRELKLTEEKDQPTIAQDTTQKPINAAISEWRPYWPGTRPIGGVSLADVQELGALTTDYANRYKTSSEYLKAEVGGGGYDEGRKLILLDEGANIRALRHELGHHKQALGGIKPQRQINRVLLEYHNIVKHENKALVLSPKLRVAYVKEPKLYSGHEQDTNTNLANWKTLMDRAKKKANLGKAWAKEERQMMLELDAALKEAKYTVVPQGWNKSAGEIIKHMLGIEIKGDMGGWSRLQQ